MINYTPHTVTVRDASGKDFVFPASGIVPRVEMSATPQKPIDGCPTILVEYGVAVLPKDHPKQCIVSTMFADAYRKTHDNFWEVELFVPDSGPTAIRENGQIIAVRALIRR
jgi:hypothetical protein